jgi:4-diphosphocytidyl-2C-methyl-D-erythritol kinase
LEEANKLEEALLKPDEEMKEGEEKLNIEGGEAVIVPGVGKSAFEEVKEGDEQPPVKVEGEEEKVE